MFSIWDISVIKNYNKVIIITVNFFTTLLTSDGKDVCAGHTYRNTSLTKLGKMCGGCCVKVQSLENS